MALPLNDLESDSLREKVLICQKNITKKKTNVTKSGPEFLRKDALGSKICSYYRPIANTQKNSYKLQLVRHTCIQKVKPLREIFLKILVSFTTK